MDLSYYNSYAEVDLGAVRENYRKVKQHIGSAQDIIPVIKGNAYGMGTVEIATTVIRDCGAKIIASAQPYESIKIRKAGFDKVTLFIMSCPPVHTFPYVVEYDLQITVFNVEAVRALSAAAKAAGKTASVQIKIETGLNRIGVKPGEPLAQLLAAIREAGNITVDGVFTHFSQAVDYEDPFTYEQYAVFEKAVAQLRAAGIEPKYIHCQNTGASVWFKKAEELCNYVRNAGLFLGYSSMSDYSNPLALREPFTWRAFISNIHEIVPGETLGYDRYFKPEKPTMVATISAGYGDGLLRANAMKFGPVMVGETKTRYLGTCMDQTFVDVTGIDCKLGDEVTIFGWTPGGKLLSIFDIEQHSGESYVYPLTSVNDRVLRIYKK